MKYLVLFLGFALITSYGCAIKKNVESAADSLRPGETICVEINPRVIEKDVLTAIELGIVRNGYRAKIYETIPSTCPFRLWYVAHQKWDFRTFLSDAQVRLFKDDELIGSVVYETPSGIFGGGGANPAKWGSTASKLGPLLDELLLGK